MKTIIILISVLLSIRAYNRQLDIYFDCTASSGSGTQSNPYFNFEALSGNSNFNNNLRDTQVTFHMKPRRGCSYYLQGNFEGINFDSCLVIFTSAWVNNEEFQGCSDMADMQLQNAELQAENLMNIEIFFVNVKLLGGFNVEYATKLNFEMTNSCIYGISGNSNGLYFQCTEQLQAAISNVNISVGTPQVESGEVFNFEAPGQSSFSFENINFLINGEGRNFETLNFVVLQNSNWTNWDISMTNINIEINNVLQTEYQYSQGLFNLLNFWVRNFQTNSQRVLNIIVKNIDISNSSPVRIVQADQVPANLTLTNLNVKNSNISGIIFLPNSEYGKTFLPAQYPSQISITTINLISCNVILYGFVINQESSEVTFMNIELANIQTTPRYYNMESPNFEAYLLSIVQAKSLNIENTIGKYTYISSLVFVQESLEKLIFSNNYFTNFENGTLINNSEATSGISILTLENNEINSAYQMQSTFSSFIALNLENLEFITIQNNSFSKIQGNWDLLDLNILHPKMTYSFDYPSSFNIENNQFTNLNIAGTIFSTKTFGGSNKFPAYSFYNNIFSNNEASKVFAANLECNNIEPFYFDGNSIHGGIFNQSIDINLQVGAPVSGQFGISNNNIENAIFNYPRILNFEIHPQSSDAYQVEYDYNTFKNITVLNKECSDLLGVLAYPIPALFHFEALRNSNLTIRAPSLQNIELQGTTHAYFFILAYTANLNSINLEFSSLDDISNFYYINLFATNGFISQSIFSFLQTEGISSSLLNYETMALSGCNSGIISFSNVEINSNSKFYQSNIVRFVGSNFEIQVQNSAFNISKWTLFETIYAQNVELSLNTVQVYGENSIIFESTFNSFQASISNYEQSLQGIGFQLNGTFIKGSFQQLTIKQGSLINLNTENQELTFSNIKFEQYLNDSVSLISISNPSISGIISISNLEFDNSQMNQLFTIESSMVSNLEILFSDIKSWNSSVPLLQLSTYQANQLSLQLRNSEFIHQSSSMLNIKLENSSNSNIEILNSEISGSTAQTFFQLFGGNISINNISISDSTAGFWISEAITQVNNSRFTNIEQENYGGVFLVTNTMLSLYSSTFTNTEAIGGGAVFLIYSELNEENTTFLNCNGTNGGGCIVSAPANMTLSLNIIDINVELMEYFNCEINFETETNTYIISNASPACFNASTLMLTFNEFGESQSFNPESLPIVNIKNSLNSFRVTPELIYLNGSDFQLVNGTEAMNNEIQVTIPFGTVTLDFNTTLQINFRECLPGEYLNPSTNLCLLCGPNYYSLNFEEACIHCNNIEGIECLGGDLISVEQNYWRMPNNSETMIIYPCIDDGNLRCVGGPNPENQCETGYAGALCSGCNYEAQYSLSSGNVCIHCSDNTFSIFISTLVSLLIGFAYEIYSIYTTYCSNINYIKMINNSESKSTENNVLKQNYLQGIHIRLLTNYMQFATIILSGLEIMFPAIIAHIDGLLIAFRLVANPATSQSSSLSCLLMDLGISPQDVPYAKIVFTIAVPIVKIALLVLGLVLMRRMGKIQSLKDTLILSVVFIALNEQPGILLTLIKFSSCFIDGNYSFLEPTVQCSNPEYLGFMDTIAYPMIFGWGLVLPSLLLAFLIIYRRSLNDEGIRTKYGYLSIVIKKAYFIGAL